MLWLSGSLKLLLRAAHWKPTARAVSALSPRNLKQLQHTACSLSVDLVSPLGIYLQQVQASLQRQLLLLCHALSSGLRLQQTSWKQLTRLVFFLSPHQSTHKQHTASECTAKLTFDQLRKISQAQIAQQKTDFRQPFTLGKITQPHISQQKPTFAWPITRSKKNTA